MSDLVCTSCGTVTTYADAYISDLERSCDGSEHEWVEPINSGIDVVV